MEETDLIFLGAQSLLANGSVEMAKGGGIVALVGAEEQKPVLVCCETYKFNDRAAINALDNKNELGCSSDVDSRFVLYDRSRHMSERDRSDIHFKNEMDYCLNNP